MKIFWLGFGLTTFGLAIVGAVLPLLPTVPFLLLSAFAFARSSERLHGWLLSHQIFGPPIQGWRKDGAISRRSKVIASLSIMLTFAVSLWMQLKTPILLIQFVTLCAVALFIWTRPEGRPSKAGKDHQADPASHT
ncbi:MAG: DUF454 domain-containing protein [Alphaproteobacteria bacterium]|nr:DUF454 domain-containing protein [Alphaproteobacteria bacterium]